MPVGGQLRIETSDEEIEETYARVHFDIEPGRYARLSVSDTGAGMDQQTQARIFEPFFTTKEQGRGTGLGLSTVFRIVKQSGGNIWVYSEPGKGTTFKIYLPCVDNATASTPPRPLPSKSPPGSETILLVEDDEQVRRLVATVLGKQGYHVLEAASGREALLICDRPDLPIHVLLTDVVMPAMSGRELAERLAVKRPEIKAIFMSGYTDDAVVHHGVSSASMAFIQKPLMPDRLLSKLREVLGTPPDPV